MRIVVLLARHRNASRNCSVCLFSHGPKLCGKNLVDCVGGRFVPPGDLLPFDLVNKITGLSARSGSHQPVYTVTNDHPDLGALFADGEAVLRLRRVNGNVYDIRCFNGLADLSGVSVHVYFDRALANESSTWGAIKACYR